MSDVISEPKPVRKPRPDKGGLHKPIMDIAGKRFGHLTAIRPTTKRYEHNVIWVYLCDCGKTVRRPRNRPIHSVRHGHAPSCGCKFACGIDHKSTIDLTGQRFGRLVALDIVRVSGKGKQHNFWRFQCDCGVITLVRAKDVKRGNTKSCGCALQSRRSPRGTHAAPGIAPGDRFGKLTVVALDKTRKGMRYYNCRCDCGGSNLVRAAILVNGQVRSCGCMAGRPRQLLDAPAPDQAPAVVVPTLVQRAMHAIGAAFRGRRVAP